MSSGGITRRLAELGHRAADGPQGVPLVTPTSAEQAAELLGTCTREGWRVRLRGAGTRPVPHAEADLVVSASALTGFDIYEPDDLTVGVRAGTTCDAAAHQLAAQRQLLPLDAPGPPAATVGGSFASGQAGPLRAAYGAPRDLALGIHLVTGDGRFLRLGGQVVKNVAGYDLVRLVVGSRGTLGLIAQVHVRLRSLPPSDVTILADVAAASEAAEIALRVRDAVAPVALELLAPTTAAGHWRCAVRLHGSADVTEAAAALVRNALPSARILEAPEATAFWRTLAVSENSAAMRIRCSALPTALSALLDAVSEFTNAKSDNGLGHWLGAAHATEGTLRIWTADGAPLAGTPWSRILADLATRIASVNGTCICDRGPAAVRELLPGVPPAPRVLQLERELRLRFDPGAILVGA